MNPRVSATEELEVLYKPRGAAAELFFCREPEVLLDGPAGTGKSRVAFEYIVANLIEYPGSRAAVVRKTRVSLTESGLVTLEGKVLADGYDAEVLTVPLAHGPGRGNRHSYEFRAGDDGLGVSELIVAGMDNPTRLFSTEFDMIYVQECTELVLNEWESLHRALRNGVMPYQQLIGDCNPDAPTHWLNQRCIAGKTRRLLSRHGDNPTLTAEYLERLSSLTGVRRQRLFLGLWTAAEGQIWENWDPALHVLPTLPRLPNGDPVTTWYVGAIDWGFRKPGVHQVWGVDPDRRMYLVEEVYRTGWTIDEWEKQVRRLNEKWKVRVWLADPSQPGYIEQYHRAGIHVREANNERRPGFDCVRDRLVVQGDGRPRMFVCADARAEWDQALREAAKPMGLTDEIPEYVWRKAKDGQVEKEDSDQHCEDHACDAARYAAMFLDYNDWGDRPKPPQYPVGSVGAILGHKKTLEAIRREALMEGMIR